MAPRRISGIWLNGGNPGQQCRIHQFGDKMFFTDEVGAFGVARIIDDRLKVGQYRIPNLEAVISTDNKRIDWPGNYWTLQEQDGRIEIYVETLSCDKITDTFMTGGSDEIFFALGGAKSTGETFVNAKFPLPPQNMDDEGPPEKRNMWNFPVWGGYLKENEWLSFVLMVWEEDRVDPGILAFVKECATSLAQKPFEPSFPNDPDVPFPWSAFRDLIRMITDDFNCHDLIGSVAASFWRQDDGTIRSLWSTIETASKTEEKGVLFGPDSSVGKFALNGSDAQYNLWVCPWEGIYLT